MAHQLSDLQRGTALLVARFTQIDGLLKVFEFDPGVGSCEVPVGFGFAGIAVVLPGGDFLDESLFVGDPAIEALGRQDAEFGFRQIEPTAMLWRVVPFEALDQAPARKGFVE